MQEIFVKTHLIITSIDTDYDVNWCGCLIDAKPKLKNGIPVFAIISADSRVELNTIDMKCLEETAKKITKPRGRQSTTIDKAYIYLIEEDEKERLMGVVTHKRIKHYAPMFDPVGYY